MRVKYLLLGLMAFVLLSCEKKDDINIDMDIPPFMVSINVVDTKSIDILNPETNNSIPLTGIRALYKGAEYQCNKDSISVVLQYCPQLFFGLNAIKNTKNGSYYLLFGGLDGSKSYKNEEITISWGDGTYDKIEFSRKLKWESSTNHYIQQEWFLNGTKVPTNNYMRVVKSRKKDK